MFEIAIFTIFSIVALGFLIVNIIALIQWKAGARSGKCIDFTRNYSRWLRQTTAKKFLYWGLPAFVLLFGYPLVGFLFLLAAVVGFFFNKQLFTQKPLPTV